MTRIMDIKIQMIPLLSPIKKLLSVEKFPTPRLWTESTVEANDPRLQALKSCKDDDKSRAIDKIQLYEFIDPYVLVLELVLIEGPSLDSKTTRPLLKVH